MSISPPTEISSGDGMWQQYRETLRVLYIVQDKKLRDVMDYMTKFHSFHAKKWEYEAQFQQWGFRKNLKKDEWAIIDQILGKRRREGKESEVILNCIPIPAKKVRKETLRNRAADTGNYDTQDLMLPPGTVVRTPVLSPVSSPVLDSILPLPTIVRPEHNVHQPDESAQAQPSPLLLPTTMFPGQNVLQSDEAEQLQAVNPHFSEMSSDQKKTIVNAISEGNITDLQRLVCSESNHSVLSGDLGLEFLQHAINDSPACYKAEIIRFLIANGAEVDRRPENKDNPWFGKHHYPPLHMAVAKGDGGITKILLDCGAKPNTRTRFGSALTLALRRKSLHCAVLLAEAGAEVDEVDRGLLVLDRAFMVENAFYYALLPFSDKARTKFTVSGIIIAANGGKSSFSNYVDSAERRNDPLRDYMLQEALCHVVCQLCLDAYYVSGMWTLLRHRVDPNVGYLAFDDTRNIEHLNDSPGDEYGDIGLDIYITQGGEEDLGNIDEYARNYYYEVSPPIIAAAREKRVWLVKALLSFGADINTPGLLGAAAWDDPDYPRSDRRFEIIEYLLNQGADVRSFGDVALHNAINGGDLATCMLLVKAGVSVNSDACGRPHLEHAITQGNFEVVRHFLKAGANPNKVCPGFCEYTALHRAAREGHLDIVKLLLASSATADIKGDGRYGSTLLETCLDCTFTRFTDQKAEIFKLMLENGATINGPTQRRSQRWNSALTIVCKNGRSHLYSQLFNIALDAGANVNQMGYGQGAMTPLQAAVQANNEDFVKRLLEAGAEINSPAAPWEGLTALQAACLEGNEDIARLLLQNGAEVNALPAIRSGWTALQGAAASGNLHIARMLLDAEADVNADAAEGGGKTALEAATRNEHVEMVKLLLDSGATNGANKARKQAKRRGRLDIAELLQYSTAPSVV